MGMKLDRKLGSALHGRDQLCCLIRHQQSRHILDADRVSPHLLDPLCSAGPVLQRISVTQRIGKSYLRMSPALLLLHPVGCIHRLLQIPQIVKAVENTDNVDAVGNGLLHEGIHHIIRIGPIAQNILSAEKHLQLGVLKAVPQLAEPIPGILLQEAKRSIEGCTAPAFHGMVSHLVHLLHNGKHEFGRHSRSNQGLMSIAQYSFRDLDRFLCLF